MNAVATRVNSARVAGPPLRGRLAGLRAGSAAGEAVASTGGTAAAVLPLIAAAGPAAPFVAAGAALVALFSSFFGGGCGTACVVAAQAEQIYEIAVDNLSAVSSKLGMISSAEFIGLAQQILAAGQQHMQALGSTQQIANGIANMAKQINQMIGAAPQTLPPSRTSVLNVAQAQTVFIGASNGSSSSGWYAGSVSAGAQLATAALQGLPPGGPSAATASGESASSGSSILQTITGSPGGLSLGTILLLGVGGLLLFKVIF